MNPLFADTDLIRVIKERKQIGAEALYDQYAVVIFRVICCTVRNSKEAETILKDTFLLAWENINDYRPENGRLLIWLAGLARAAAKKAAKLKPDVFVSVPTKDCSPVVPNSL